MKKGNLVVNYQHLTGNDPEGFNARKWIDAVKEATIKYFDEYEVDFREDIQSASGYCKEMEFLLDSDASFEDFNYAEQAIIRQVGDYGDPKWYECESKTLNQLDEMYDEGSRFQTTADNLTNGQFEVEMLNDEDRYTHLKQAYEIYCDEAE